MFAFYCLLAVKIIICYLVRKGQYRLNKAILLNLIQKAKIK